MPDSHKFRALIVDDASLIRIYYRDILERSGYHVDEALNGIEAMETVLQNPPDFIVLDVNMPQMDGISFLKVLRRQASALASIPVIIASTESEEHDKADARAAGANHYLVKPLREDVLVHYAALLAGRPT